MGLGVFRQHRDSFGGAEMSPHFCLVSRALPACFLHPHPNSFAPTYHWWRESRQIILLLDDT